MAKAEQYFYAVGKRKTSIAKVYLTPSEKGGKVEVNGKDIREYFSGNYVGNIISPLVLTDNVEKYDIKIVLVGGGFSSQSDAARHGIARALEVINADLRTPLKAAGFLTRDPRRKERKKFGKKKARKSPQWSKR
ncbi:TPA: 30S ribosomal protein S9 [Candidatus Gracilibacteria bacterium]|nr:30S ribosomal protein S9 [Candidatus Gracilibacteria bacterium]HIQ57420.1 30S ribosomal protein S9 [Candidatus Gracilibacteria bacterium]